jgi:hypothetical protein
VGSNFMATKLSDEKLATNKFSKKDGGDSA